MCVCVCVCGGEECYFMGTNLIGRGRVYLLLVIVHNSPASHVVVGRGTRRRGRRRINQYKHSLAVN